MNKKNIYLTTYDLRWEIDGMTLDKVIEYLQELKQEIIEEYGDSVECELEIRSYDDYTEINIDVHREETDDEYQKRIQEDKDRIKQNKEALEKKERKLYERLKKKYEK